MEKGRASFFVLHLGVTLALVTLQATSAHAQETSSESEERASSKEEAQELRRVRFDKLSMPPSGYARVLLGLGLGAGLRFNNPYRLATQLGSTAESMSTTAPYTMLSAAMTFGKPDGLQHGGFVGASFAITGVSQSVLTPAYMLLYRGPRRTLGYARAGAAIVLSPDVNVGPEIAAGGAFFVTGGLGVSLDVAGNLFYGASTWQKTYPVYPVLSATLGVIVDLEMLP